MAEGMTISSGWEPGWYCCQCGYCPEYPFCIRFTYATDNPPFWSAGDEFVVVEHPTAAVDLGGNPVPLSEIGCVWGFPDWTLFPPFQLWLLLGPANDFAGAVMQDGVDAWTFAGPDSGSPAGLWTYSGVGGFAFDLVAEEWPSCEGGPGPWTYEVQ